MKVIVDASCAFIMLATPERVGRIFAHATGVLAPELIVAEVLDASWKLSRFGAAAPSLSNVLGLLERIELVAILPFAADAAELAHRLDHPIYDCVYAVFAKRERARLVTADRRFAAKLTNEAVDVVTL